MSLYCFFMWRLFYIHMLSRDDSRYINMSTKPACYPPFLHRFMIWLGFWKKEKTDDEPISILDELV
jgi:hypothetical protein